MLITVEYMQILAHDVVYLKQTKREDLKNSISELKGNFSLPGVRVLSSVKKRTGGGQKEPLKK